MAGPNTPLAPHYTHQPTSVRRAYIQNLTDLLHVCLLRRDTVRARRAWSILIRCREIDWKSRWYWGLQCLNASAAAENQLASTSQPEYEGREVERWLKGVRVSAREVDKPSLLHALVLHLIKHERFRQALDELETYLTSYPYLLSGPLHTYAGLLSFYLAQPPSNLAKNASTSTTLETRTHIGEAQAAEIDSAQSVSSRVSSRSDASTIRQSTKTMEPPNPILIRQARAYFVKALAIDETDVVAAEFIENIDHPEQSRDRSIDLSRDEDDGSEGKSDEDVSVDGKDDEDKADESDDSGTDLEALMGAVLDEDDDIES